MADQSSSTNASALADIQTLLDLISRSSGLGALSSSYANLMSGFDHRGMGSALPIHTEGNGLVFFTRPNLNLSYDNLAQDRMLTPLLTDNVYTYQRAIRAMLDPVGAGMALPSGTVGKSVTSPLFNERQAFIPILTNTILSLNGWPDISLDTYTSTEGRLRENWSIGDGTSKNYQVNQLNATFRNIGGDPITLLFAVWATYIDHVHQDVMAPYLENIMENRVDYGSRIFRFTMDPSRTRIQKYASAMGCFPIGVPLGAAMNFSRDTPYGHDNQQEVAIGFQVHGAEYLDPIILQEFNEIVATFNPDMADATRASGYTKVDYAYLKHFNSEALGYPWINMQTSELEWWVESTNYENIVSGTQSLATAAKPPATTSKASLPNLAAGTPSASQGDPLFPAAGYAQALTDLAGDQFEEPSASTTSSS